MGQEVVRLWHKEHDLQGAELVILPGGFSYGDYLRSGSIARFSPIMQQVIQHAQKGGLVLGICNGFQILTEAGLLPGALLHNQQQRFVCKNVYLKPQNSRAALTSQLNTSATYQVPVAHAEGRFFIDAAGLAQLKANNQIMFQYTEANGQLTEQANFNGSVESIAGVCNEQGNVMGLMPHPERAAEAVLGNVDGHALFDSLLAGAGAMA